MIIAIAVLSVSAASAQSRHDNDRMQDRNQAIQTRDDWHNKDQRQSNDYGYKNNNRDDDRKRQADYDRMNQQYDRRINDYRNDRSLNRYERDRRIREVEQERQQQSKSFGKGLIVGGAVAVLLGVLIGH